MNPRIRTALVIAAVYILIAAVLIIREEWVTAQQFRAARLSQGWYERKAEYLETQPVLQTAEPTVGWDCRSADIFPSYRVQLVYLLNFPTVPVLGWYGHPITACSSSLMTRVSQKLKLQVHGWYRIVLFDSVLLLAVGVHWFLLGYILLRLHVPISVLKFFTGFAVLIMCIALP